MADTESNNTFNSISNESNKKADAVMNWKNTWRKVGFYKSEAEIIEDIKEVFDNWAGDDKIKIKQLLELKNDRGSTLMNWVIDKREVFQYALDKFKSLNLSEEEIKSFFNIENGHGSTLLIRSIIRKDVQIVRDLLESGADVNTKNAYGHSYLHYALVGEGAGIQIVQELAQKSSEEVIKEALNTTWARGEYKEVLEKALERFEHPDQENQVNNEIETAPVTENVQEETPVLEENVSQEEPVSEVEAQESVDQVNQEVSQPNSEEKKSEETSFEPENGLNTILMFPPIKEERIMDWRSTWKKISFENKEKAVEEVQKMFGDWAEEDNSKIKQLLTLKDDKGNTALMDAVRYDNENLVQFLMDKWASFDLSEEKEDLWNMQNDDGWAPLHQAVYRGNVLIVQKLIDRKVDLNLQNDKGWTPLFQAVVCKDEVIVQSLLDAGADETIASNVGWTPLFRASFDNNTQIEGILKQSIEGQKQEVIEEKAVIKDQIQAENQKEYIQKTQLQEDAIQKDVAQERKTVQEVHVVEENTQVSVVQNISTEEPVVQEVMETVPVSEEQEVRKIVQEENVAERVNQEQTEENKPENEEVNQEEIKLNEQIKPEQNREERKGVFARWNDNMKRRWFFTWRKVDFEKDSEKEILEKVQRLLENGADINARDENGDTALMYAAAYGKAKVVECLIAHGADVNLADKDDDNALIMAARFGYTDIVESLIKNNVRLNDKNKYGETALISAAREGQVSVVSKLLENENVELNMADNSNQTALMCAVEGHSSCKKDEEKKPFMDIVEMLMSHGADRSKAARSLATSLGNMTMDRVIKKYEHEIARKEFDEKKLMEDKLEAFKKLIDWREERKALEIMESDRGAIRRKIVSLQKMLEKCSVEAEDAPEAGASIQSEEKTIILAAESKKKTENVKMGWFKRLVRMCKTTLMGEWLYSFGKVNWDCDNDAEIIRKIQTAIANGANINMQEDDGNTILHYATFYGKKKVVEYLFKNKANVELSNNIGNSALVFAARRGYTDIIDLFIKNNADLNAKNKDGETALMAAVKAGRFDVVKKLVQSGKVDVNLTDNNKQTALMFAAEQDFAQIVTFLMENNADERMKDNNGSTALTKSSLLSSYSQSAHAIRKYRQRRYAEKDFAEKMEAKKNLIAIKTIFAGDEKDLENNPSAIRERIALFANILRQSTDKRRREALMLRDLSERRRRRGHVKEDKKVEIRSNTYEKIKKESYSTRFEQELARIKEEHQKYVERNESVYKKISEDFERLHKGNQEKVKCLHREDQEPLYRKNQEEFERLCRRNQEEFERLHRKNQEEFQRYKMLNPLVHS